MATREELADDLARDVIAAMEQTGDDRLWELVSKEMGAASVTSQEAFVTAIRIRLADGRARKFLEAHMAKIAAKAATPE